MTEKFGVILTVWVLFSHAVFAVDQHEISIPWNDLSAVVVGRTIRMILPNGPRIEGKAVVVEPEQLRVRITKTSNPRVQPRGQALIPRTAVSAMQVVRYGVRWRITGMIAGPLLVAATAVTVVAHTGAGNLNTAAGLTAGGILGGAVAGYYTGKRADRRIVTIRIVGGSH
jgi:hypothetical protein